MKNFRILTVLFLSACVTLFGTACQKPDHGDGHDHDHDHEEAHGKEGGHGHAEESPSGASFKAGTGITLTDETKQLLGVEVADIEERNLPNQIPFTVQVYDEKHHHLPDEADHSGCDVHGAGFLPEDNAVAVKTGQRVEILKGTNSPLDGVVLAVQKALALGESEIVIGVSNATASL